MKQQFDYSKMAPDWLAKSIGFLNGCYYHQRIVHYSLINGEALRTIVWC